MGEDRGRKELGRKGEDAACRHLESQGFEIVARNHRTRAGEIDIVARRGELTVFVEVKARRSLGFGEPVESVTPEKAGRLKRLAGEYLSEYGGTPDIRFDVISVLYEAARREPTIDHIPNAF